MLAEIARDLQEHENSARIKKLVFCVCKKRWENDVALIAQYPFESLLQELVTNHSDVEQLTQSLYRVVETLNRKAVYYPIADTVVHKLEHLYPEENNATQVVAAVSPIQPSQESSLNFDKILQRLESNGNSLRVKKILLCACENRWENNPKVLVTTTLKDLVLELLKSSPTKEQLSQRLYDVAKSVNRQAEYLSIANFIIKELTPLYSATEGNTQMIFAKSPSLSFAPVASAPTPSVATERDQSWNPFNLRLQLMKYTNPLRAKIVLFSVLNHPFDFSSQDWAVLKTYSLDELLLQLFHHCETLPELQSKLNATAKALAQPYESTQAAGAIFQSLKPLYTHS